jgi:hypothetical protein
MAKKTKKRVVSKAKPSRSVVRSSKSSIMESPIYGYVAVGIVFIVLALLLSGLNG